MMLADDSDVMRAFSIIKEKYPEFANTVENIYKDIVVAYFLTLPPLSIFIITTLQRIISNFKINEYSAN